MIILSMKIKELPELERPYEKLEMYGEKVLSDAELLAIIIKTGTKEETAVQLAQRLLSLNNTEEENLKFLQTLTIQELMEQKGIGKVKAIQLKAVGEIAIRMFRTSNYNKKIIKKPQDLAKILMSDLYYQKEEIVKIVILNTKNEILKIEDIAKGGTNLVNIPIKASSNIENKKHSFKVELIYKNYVKTTSLSINSGGTNNEKGRKVIQMKKMAGETYLIACKVNGLPLNFIFDTGASSVTLSKKEAAFMLSNGYLSTDDIIGQASFQTADGNIAVGTIVKLKKIEISGLVLYNVNASIINNDNAPLLLGQSALSKLGKIQIDYNNSTLTIIR